MVVCHSISRQWIRSLQCPILVDLDGVMNIDLLGILRRIECVVDEHFRFGMRLEIALGLLKQFSDIRKPSATLQLYDTRAITHFCSSLNVSDYVHSVTTLVNEALRHGIP
ncbi:hypothetical protein ARMGADRAFT_1064496 [Armillaria gallica]|uniref:Uncharacterized protein n=1 Tax=Armillaria gallica TaxID=47427 RepID=A0A2H3DFX7_ARMGA|nr:hypothetical protein ARMGADRAFT_1064496 [Armillaria gallica]